MIESGVWKGHWHSMKHVSHVWPWDLAWAEDFSKAALFSDRALRPRVLDQWLHPGHSNFLCSWMMWDKGLPVKTACLWVSPVSGGRTDISARKTWCPGWHHDWEPDSSGARSEKSGGSVSSVSYGSLGGSIKWFLTALFWPIFLLFLTAPSGRDLQ